MTNTAPQLNDHLVAAVESAGREWLERAYWLLVDYLEARRARPFTADEFIGWAEKRGPRPPDPLAWHAAIACAAIRYFIERAGYAPISGAPTWRPNPAMESAFQ